MKQREFDALANECFRSVLVPYGFTNEGSMRCTFYRKGPNGVYHFIIPSVGTGGTWYCIRVFPDSPHIDPLFERRFPDGGGIPTDSFSCLSEKEVGLTQRQFNCKNEENFRKGFSNKVSPLLLKVAIPYLDRFQTVADIIPAIRHPSFLGFALHHVGRTSEAVAVLSKERERLRRLDTTNTEVASMLEHVESLLGPQ
jgi:hypothetical protein